MVAEEFSGLSDRLLVARPGERHVFPLGVEITIIPTGIEIEKFADAKPLSRQDIGVDKTDVLVVCVAHLVPVKGHVELIHAVAAVADELPKLKLLLAGQGEEAYERNLRNLVSSLRLTNRVIFLGSNN